MTAMPFGRFRGTPLSELPPWYLEWLLSLDNLRDPLLSAVQAEVARRAAEEPPPRKPPLAEVRQAATEIVAIGYHQLARRYHPDHGGSHQAMTSLNLAHEWLRERVEHR